MNKIPHDAAIDLCIRESGSVGREIGFPNAIATHILDLDIFDVTEPGAQDNSIRGRSIVGFVAIDRQISNGDRVPSRCRVIDKTV